MWTYWYLQEGEVEIDPAGFVTDDGKPSAVLHVDSDQPLHADDGKLVSDQPWGVYFKPDRTSIQGGAEPLTVGPEFEVDPYPTGTIDPRLRRDVARRPCRTASSGSRGRADISATSAPEASGRSPSTTSPSSTS